MEENIRQAQRRERHSKKPEKQDRFSPVTVAQILLCIILTIVFVITAKSGGTASQHLKADFQRLMSWTIEKSDTESVINTVKEYLSSSFEFLPAFSPVAPPEIIESADDAAAESDEASDEETTGVTEEASEDDGSKSEAAEETTAEKDTTEDETTQSSEVETLKLSKSTDSGGKDMASYEAKENTTFSPVATTSPILAPVESTNYTSYFGYRINPITNEHSFHTGLDIAASLGTKIRAAYNGTVRKVGEDSHSGKYIFLTHSDGYETFYCHCSEIVADEGAVIRQGETIALVGSTGWATGPHLHFEIRKDGTRLNPLWVLEDATDDN